jgi:hypothetical protein
VNDHSLAGSIERIWRSGAEYSAALGLTYKIAVISIDNVVAVSSQFRGKGEATTMGKWETRQEREAFFRCDDCRLGDIKPLSNEERSIFPAIRLAPEAINCS